MGITAQDIKKLRDMTGAGMMDCKKALSEADGDFEKAIEELRKKGQKLSAKRADREAKEGVVIAMTTDDRSNGVLIKLSCETDFVAKNESFVELGKTIAGIALKNLPDTREALLALPFDDTINIGDKVIEQIGVIGEKVEVLEYEKIVAAGDGQVLSYIHMGYKAGVLVELNMAGDQFVEPGRDVAMQIAAMKPIALDESGVDATVIAKEIEIGKEIARQEGKPEEMLEKIATGKLNKFFKENTLMNQKFVKNSKTTVKGYLESQDGNLTVTTFKHVKLG